MMKQAFTKLGVFTLLSLLCPAFLYAQVVTDERMFSFEDPQVPECISATRSQLSISDTHYKDGKHSDRKSTRLNSSHRHTSRMPSSA